MEERLDLNFSIIAVALLLEMVREFLTNFKLDDKRVTSIVVLMPLRFLKRMHCNLWDFSMFMSPRLVSSHSSDDKRLFFCPSLDIDPVHTLVN
ncbi:hypothetical protein NC651_029008 [Populus alba x Populus x berolinensis]|nr:hypothetical protein NC651_029008 [Populus alba x Populus x berolinensis]